MMSWDIAIAAIGFTCLVYAVTPERLRFWRTTRVITTIDSDNSDVYYIGGKLLTVGVTVAIENQLDRDAQLKHVGLAAVMRSDSTLEARNVAFQSKGSTLEVATDRVHIPARARCDGWFIFTFDVNIRPADFKHFRMQVRAIGEPLERFRFEPYDWEDAKKGGTKIVLLPPRWRWRH